MKKFFWFSFFLVITGFLLVSCPELYTGDPALDGNGTILISINGQDERTIMPSVILNDFIRYNLDFTAETDGNEDFSLTWTSGYGILELPAGTTWELTVTAFLKGELLDELEAAKSEPKSFTVNAGDNAPVNIELLPLEEGEGTFSWNLNFDGSFTSALMQIWRTGKGGNPDTLLGEETVNFIENSLLQDVNLEKEIILDAGEYRVIFTLANSEETVRISEILHVYKNMESNFTYTFTDRHFSVELLDYLLSAWDGSAWDFESAEIIAGHFPYLEINGVYEGNFDEVVRWMNELCASGDVPGNLIELKTLVDASLIGIASEDAVFLNYNNYVNKGEAQDAISALAVNETDLDFEWENDDRTVRVQAGGYFVELEFYEAVFPVIEMSWIPAGIFTMGSPETEPDRHYWNETQHEVTLSNGFYMGKYTVTQEQYEAVMGVNPSYFTIANGHDPLDDDIQGRRPVESVSWHHAIAFCNRLSILEGLTPVYSIEGISNTDADAWLHSEVPINDWDAAWDAVTVNWDASGYRLPTEAQWEYACRAGTATAFNWGSDQITSDQANFYAIGSLYNGSPAGEYRGATTEVGRFAPNAWGLYDMHGNVWEWCWDWWDGNDYPSGSVSDPTGAVSGSNRVLRGGSWNDDGQFLRSAQRDLNFPWAWSNSIGFRLVRP